MFISRTLRHCTAASLLPHRKPDNLSHLPINLDVLRWSKRAQRIEGVRVTKLVRIAFFARNTLVVATECISASSGLCSATSAGWVIR